MKSSEISNENVSCGHTQDGQHGYACQHRAAAVREIWGKLDLIFTFSGMQVTTIGITFFPPFFSWFALIKNFGPSRSKHTTKLTKPILFSWLARDHWHWELFYKCNQCNYEYTFVENLRTHKKTFFYKCIQCNYECIFEGSLRNHKQVFLQIATNDNVTMQEQADES